MKKDYPDIQALENEKWQDPDPVTGKLGTRVPAKWLQLVENSSKSLTLEVLEVLKEAKIEPNELKNTQLKDAIVAIAAARIINWKDVQNAPKILDVLGDSKIDGASQRVVNEVNKLAENAQTSANDAKSIAQSKQDKNAWGFGDKSAVAKGNDFVSDSQYYAGYYINERIEGLGNAHRPFLNLPWGINHQAGTQILGSEVGLKDPNDVSLFARNYENGKFNKAVRLLTSLSVIKLNELDVPVDHIFTFDSDVSPAGFIARNGQAISEEKMPKLFKRYGGVMPDDRDRTHRMYGSLAGGVGSTQEDAMQKIEASVGGFFGRNPSGAFYFQKEDGGTTGGPSPYSKLLFDSSRVARTANETRVKSKVVLFCNKIQ